MRGGKHPKLPLLEVLYVWQMEACVIFFVVRIGEGTFVEFVRGGWATEVSFDVLADGQVVRVQSEPAFGPLIILYFRDAQVDTRHPLTFLSAASVENAAAFLP